MFESDSDESGCENCQTSGDEITDCRTPYGTRRLCASCYTDILGETKLSPRESEVYAYSNAGYTNKDIAEELDLDSSTIAGHLARVRQKFIESIKLTDLIEPVNTTSEKGLQEFDSKPPEGLEPGSIVELTDQPASPQSTEDYTHGIVRKVLTRSDAGVPVRVSVYPVNPDTGSILIHEPVEMPAVIDEHAEFTDVVFPKDVVLNDLPLKIDSG